MIRHYVNGNNIIILVALNKKHKRIQSLSDGKQLDFTCECYNLPKKNIAT